MSVVNGLTLVLLPGNLIIKAVSAEAHAAQNVVAPSPLLPVFGDCIPLAVPHFFVEHASKIKALAQVTAAEQTVACAGQKSDLVKARGAILFMSLQKIKFTCC